MMEEWMPIKGYEGLYEISNLGNVKSLERDINSTWGTQNVKIKRKERILKYGYDSSGYAQVKLCNNDKGRTMLVHHLVWDAFGNGERNGRKIQIDHIDGNKKNPSIQNLRLATNRQNVTNYVSNKKKSGLPTGVSYDPARINQINKYGARIKIGNKNKYLGRFPTVELASKAYQKALMTLVTD